MISKHDVVGGGRFTKWQLEVGGQTQGQSRHVTYVQHTLPGDVDHQETPPAFPSTYPTVCP